MVAQIRNPVEWTKAQLVAAGHAFEDSGHIIAGTELAPPVIRRIKIADLKDALKDGLGDFAAMRSDVIMLCLIYPLVGLLLATWIFGQQATELLFPIAAGFALVGPGLAIGLYEMSRRREQGREASWTDISGVIASPRFGAMLVLMLLLLAIFAIWLLSAEGIYNATLGPEKPTSLSSFVVDALTTTPGWIMIGTGMIVGFVFALIVLSISALSFPLVLDRNVGLPTAILTSVRAMIVNPVPMLSWGLIVAVGLVIGSIPLFLGLAIVVPVLGHATWHLYRKAVVPAGAVTPAGQVDRDVIRRGAV